VIGKARSGKDTFSKMLANALFDKSGKKYILMAYATELKKRVQTDFDLSYEQLWGNAKEIPDLRYPKDNFGASSNPADYWTPREILQNYGQFFRTIDYDFWVRALFNVIDEKEYKNVILTDVRHPNEAYPINDRGGFTIRISRNIETDVHNQQHISEVAMDDYEVDFEVKNFGDLEGLQKTAEKLADVIISSKTEITIIGGKKWQKQKI